MQRHVILAACVLSTGCELVSGLSDLSFEGSGGGGGTSTSAGGAGGATTTANGGGGATTTANVGGGTTSSVGGAGGAGGAGGGTSTAIDELFGGRDRRTCARRGDDYYCWGYTNGVAIGAPVLTTFPVGTTFVAPGTGNNCVIANGALQCWGIYNIYGELGVGDTNGHAFPQPVDVPVPVVSYANDAENACALSGAPADLYCWGDSSYGQVVFPGDSDAHPDPTLVTIPGTGDLAAIGVGTFHVCAQRGTEAYCWGHNQYGSLGIGIDDLLDHPPTKVASADPVGQLVVYSDGGCIVSTTGAASCWGYAFDDSADPVPVAVLDGAVGLSAGRAHVCGIVGGEVACAGLNDQFQLGYPNNTIVENVIDIPGGAARVVCGTEHTCALSLDGDVYCWGDNNGGALGFGSTVSMLFATPQKVTFPAP